MGSLLPVTEGAAAELRLSLPLEYKSGFATGGARPVAFEGGFTTAVLLRFGPHRTRLAGPAVRALYDDGGWSGAAGVRIGTRLTGVRDAGIFAFAEILRGRDRTPLSLLVVADLPVKPALFARFGVCLTRDLARDRTTIALTLGTDLARWVHEGQGDSGPRVVAP
jgi:hypothetical protein